MNEYPERLITAFMTSCKRAEIMKRAGIGKNKYYALKTDPDFMRIVTERRDELVREAVLKMESYLSENVEALQKIIRDPETKDHVRVSALTLFSNQLGQWRNSTEILDRLQKVEDAQRQNRDV